VARQFSNLPEHRCSPAVVEVLGVVDATCVVLVVVISVEMSTEVDVAFVVIKGVLEMVEVTNVDVDVVEATEVL